ncbi:tryptophan--tRNA ligase [Candidatus Cerribacteria bacterium 'Amazon FNV 2010 28 9']|uniref:Tryptophan--tRNA ligase n=1 Tax=Candidatus Cerribacteria bacterium 'Amazon FNV 2010 28 9' TaxID=2081795 RepID=A0A317JT38_9BACT|nr:MAG: tryptophan--tRNA ligase [Candidatus Cerribacteria bacterium 'Amazon FNV 2010 28 9']
MGRKVVLTGMRTTGSLHLGHYVGALKQWKQIQDAGEHECYFLLADVQALTTHADNPTLLSRSVIDVTKDWLAIGLDPTLPNVHFVLQSQVPERYELSALFMMIARYSEVIRNPTLKTELKRQENASMGFIAYPVDQVADIYMVNPYPIEEDDEVLVPVGEDQVPHLEYARDLAERFNNSYGPVFTPCQPLVGEVGRLVGIDGKAKMSKSMGNSIDLSDSAAVVKQKVMSMYTDPNHARVDDPGDSENNPVFMYLRAFDPNQEEVEELADHYRRGGVGDVALKRRLVGVLNDFLEPIRQRRAEYEKADLGSIIFDGSHAARQASIPVIEAVRQYMSLIIP